jgi:hypothetical protein
MTIVAHLPVVAGVEIPVDAEGRYNLNVLHLAYEAEVGQAKHKRPSQWLKTQQSKNLVVAVEKTLSYPPVITQNGGSTPGTWAVPVVALAYASWVDKINSALHVFSSIEDAGAVLQALANFEVPDDLPDMYVYAIQETDTGNIKLGISKNPQKRLKVLQIGNSSKLRLVAYKKAENRFKDEAYLHSLAAPLNLHGEWFNADAAVVMQ